MLLLGVDKIYFIEIYLYGFFSHWSLDRLYIITQTRVVNEILKLTLMSKSVTELF